MQTKSLYKTNVYLSTRLFTMVNENDTNMRVSLNFKAWLDTLKIHENQPYAEVCDRIKKLLSRERDLKDKLNGIKI